MTRLEEAVIFATKMHDGQKRKITGLPYILHPMETAVVVSTMTDDEDIIIAALLHDVIEDTQATAEDVKNMFGERVLSIVESETENKRSNLPAESTWKIRKEEALDKLRHSNKEMKMMWLADKVSNLRSMANEYMKIGDKIFDAFHQKDKAEHEWYYRMILQIVKDDLGETFAFKQYVRLTNFIFGGENNEI